VVAINLHAFLATHGKSLWITFHWCQFIAEKEHQLESFDWKVISKNCKSFQMQIICNIAEC